MSVLAHVGTYIFVLAIFNYANIELLTQYPKHNLNWYICYMDINQFYKMVKFIANKNQQGYISPDDFNGAVNLAQNQLMEDLINQIQGWDGNKRRIKIPMGNAQPTIQKIAPFIVRSDPNTGVILDAGDATKPSDLVHMLAIRTSGDFSRIMRVEHDRVFSHFSSKIDLPSQNPFYIEYSDSYRIFPSTLLTISWEYIKNPPEAKWAYTLVGGRPVYDSSNSIQLLWGESEVTELISRVLFMFGISVQAQNLIAYYQSIKNDGQ